MTETIISEIRQYVVAVGRRHCITLNLTSGRDSRMLLACCRGEPLAQVLFHTLPNAGSDLAIARVITRHFKLPHVVSEKPPFDRVLLQGLGGEVGRCFYWRREDLHRGQPTVDALVARLLWGQVAHPAIIKTLGSWLDEVPAVRWSTILDLAYIELRLACAMGPAMYSHERDCVFSAYPMNGRKIFSAMMRLPEKGRFQQMLYMRILKTRWPELLIFPLHKAHWTGLDRYFALLQLARNTGKWELEQKSTFLRIATANRTVRQMVLDDILAL